jgi:hypothetical protein
MQEKKMKATLVQQIYINQKSKETAFFSFLKLDAWTSKEEYISHLGETWRHVIFLMQ